MTKFSLKYLLLLVGVILITVHACKKDEEECCDPSNPECSNYDPCLGQNPTSADFQFLAKYGVGDDALWIPETNFIGSPIRFSAVDKNADSYTWYLGTDTITGTDEVQLDIANLPEGSYSAILVAEKEPNLECFPYDTGLDSLEKSFEVVDFCDRLCTGKFRGIINTISLDSITVEIEFADITTNEVCTGTFSPRFINVLGQSDTLFSIGSYGTYSRVFFTGNGSGTLRGELSVDQLTNLTSFNYQLGNMDYVFTGIKID